MYNFVNARLARAQVPAFSPKTAAGRPFYESPTGKLIWESGCRNYIYIYIYIYI